MYSKNEKRPFILIVFILCGLVVGGFIGQYLGGHSYTGWLNYGAEFGLDKPFSLDMGIIRLQLLLMFKINISGVIGMILAVFLYRRMM